MIELLELLKLAQDAQTQQEVSQSLATLAEVARQQDMQIRLLQAQTAHQDFLPIAGFVILFLMVCAITASMAWDIHKLKTRIKALEAK